MKINFTLSFCLAALVCLLSVFLPSSAAVAGRPDIYLYNTHERMGKITREKILLIEDVERYLEPAKKETSS